MYPDVTQFKDVERRRKAVQDGVRNLLTGGLMGRTLSWLPFGGRSWDVSPSQKLLAPLTIMAFAEAKFFMLKNTKSETYEYVLRLWRGTLDADLDCCTTSTPVDIVALLNRIGTKEVKTKNTIKVGYIFENDENLFTGDTVPVLRGIKVSKDVVLMKRSTQSTG